MKKVITRKEAEKLQLLTYYTGKACKYGHYSERYTKGSQCLECITVYNSTNRERLNEWNRKRNDRRRDYIKEHNQNYYKKNKDKINTANKAYYENNKEQHNKRQRQVGAQRRASKIDRTVGWANVEKIKEFYKNCPEGHHVDHIVPLQATLVSGLHVENNLQYLTKEENLSKGNKFIPTIEIKNNGKI